MWTNWLDPALLIEAREYDCFSDFKKKRLYKWERGYVKGMSTKQMLKANKKKWVYDFIELLLPYRSKPYFVIDSEDWLSYLFNDWKRREQYITRTNNKVWKTYDRNNGIILELENLLQQAKEWLNDIGIYNTMEEYETIKASLDWIYSKLEQEDLLRKIREIAHSPDTEREKQQIETPALW